MKKFVDALKTGKELILIIAGIITFIIAFLGLQPKSRAASYKFLSISPNLGSTDNTT